MPLVREVLDVLGIPIVEQAGYEADDLIATLVDRATTAGLPVLIVTGDRDTLQLVDDAAGVRVMMTRRGVTDTVTYDEAGVLERYGVTPGRYVDLAALRGDSSDNLPGVTGIGPKTAAHLERMGIKTLGALADADEAALIARFGRRLGSWLSSRARFEDDSEVIAVREAVSESRETTFNEDVAEPAELERVLRSLATQLCDGLARHGRRGRTIGIKVRLDDWTTVTRARTIAQATNETAVVADIAVDLLREYAPPRPVRLVGVRVAGLAANGDRGAAEQLALDM
jgi:hypothetical protein